VVKKVQGEFGSDIFGFGNMIYRKDPKLWKKLREDWSETFSGLSVEVSSKIEIVTTSWLEKKGV
jgi:spore germination protein KC